MTRLQQKMVALKSLASENLAPPATQRIQLPLDTKTPLSF